jgi:hypothetical protein
MIVLNNAILKIDQKYETKTQRFKSHFTYVHAN